MQGKYSKVNVFTPSSPVTRRNALRSLVRSVRRRLRGQAKPHISGPKKVELNLLKGLHQLGVHVEINPTRVFATDPSCCLQQALIDRLPAPLNWFALGPNLSARFCSDLVKSGHIPRFFIVPSPYVRAIFSVLGVPDSLIKVWPVGIDTDRFGDTRGCEKEIDALVYFKHRTEEELECVQAMLTELGQTARVLRYGFYKEADLLRSARRCRYAVVLDYTESQGIAIQELMSCNLPLFVFDQVYQGDSEVVDFRDNFQVTSVPYWSDICGTRVPTDRDGRSPFEHYQIGETRSMFEEFLSRLGSFQPRQYVLTHLSLSGQASQFLDLFEPPA